MPCEYTSVRAVVFAVAGAQCLFWLYTLWAPRAGLVPFDLVMVWLTAPALFFATQQDWAPLGGGLAAAALVIQIGLLIA